METYSTHAITSPGRRPVRVDFNETERGTFVASVKDAHEGFVIRSFSTVEISRAEFDALPFSDFHPELFSNAAMELFTKPHPVMDIEPLDHGVLSIPNRTKNINRDLDAFKLAQAKKLRAERRERRELAKQDALARKPLEAQALELYKTHGRELRAAVKGKLYGTGQTPAEWLKCEAKARPQWFINWAAEVLR